MYKIKTFIKTCVHRKFLLSFIALGISAPFFPTLCMEEKNLKEVQPQDEISLESMFQQLIKDLDAKSLHPLRSSKTEFLDGPKIAWIRNIYDHILINKESVDELGLEETANFVLTVPGEWTPFIEEGQAEEETEFLLGQKIAPYLIGIAFLVKRYGNGDVNTYNGPKDDNRTEPFLFEYESPNGKMDVTIYSMLAAILKEADKLKKANDQNPIFIQNYKAFHDALEQAIIMKTNTGRINQVEGYLQALDKPFLETAFIEGIRNGKIDAEWLFEYLQEGMMAKEDFKGNK